jgi:uncharacterized membrane protein YoaK (UPF0700 family)
MGYLTLSLAIDLVGNRQGKTAKNTLFPTFLFSVAAIAKYLLPRPS